MSFFFLFVHKFLTISTPSFLAWANRKMGWLPRPTRLRQSPRPLSLVSANLLRQRMLTTNPQVREGNDNDLLGLFRRRHVARNTALVTEVKHVLDLQFLVGSDFSSLFPHGASVRAGRSGGDGKMGFHLMHQFHRLGIVVNHDIFPLITL
jgi:hypothetical protein